MATYPDEVREKESRQQDVSIKMIVNTITILLWMFAGWRGRHVEKNMKVYDQLIEEKHISVYW